MQARTVQFIGLGGMYSGAGFVYTYLHEHPQTCIPKQRTDFFSNQRVYERGLDWYEAQFSTCGDSQLRGEAAYSYIDCVDAVGRIAKQYPRAKLLAVVSNPIDRLYREYQHTVTKQKSSRLSFAQYLERYPSSLQRGLFGTQLSAYFELYSPVQLRVMLHEDRYEDPVRYVQGVYKFLEIDPTFVPKRMRSLVEIDPNDPPPRPWYMKLIRIIFFPVWLLQLDRLGNWLWKWVKPHLRQWLRYDEGRELDRAHEPPSLPIHPELRAVLCDYYAADVRTLSRLMNRDLNAEWDIYPSDDASHSTDA